MKPSRIFLTMVRIIPARGSAPGIRKAVFRRRSTVQQIMSVWILGIMMKRTQTKTAFGVIPAALMADENN
jgi:hypothetical protein